MLFSCRIVVDAHDPSRIIESKRNCAFGGTWISNSNETGFDLRVIHSFVEFDVLREPSSRTVPNRVHIGVDSSAKRVAPAMVNSQRMTIKILISGHFHPRHPKISLKQHAAENAIVTDSSHRPAARSGGIRCHWVHVVEGAISPYPAAVGKRVR